MTALISVELAWKEPWKWNGREERVYFSIAIVTASWTDRTCEGIAGKGINATQLWTSWGTPLELMLAAPAQIFITEILPVWGFEERRTHSQCWNKVNHAKNPRNRSTVFRALEWDGGHVRGLATQRNDQACIRCCMVTARDLGMRPCSRWHFEFLRR